MPLVPIDNVGQVGIIKDTPPYNLPPNAWSDGNNVRFLDNGVKKVDGYQEVMKTIPFAPYYITPYLAADGTYRWVGFGEEDIAVWNGSSWTDTTRQSTMALNGPVSASAGTITVSTGAALTALDATGTLVIGNDETATSNQYESITYSARDTGTGVITLSGTTSYAHPSGAVVTPAGATATADDDYSANEKDRKWTATNLNGLLVATNGYDTPQMWPLSAGSPSLTTPFRELRNWIQGNKCNVIRSFRTFLVGLNWERNYREPRLVKWSTEASYGTAPVTWQKDDNTLDAGEYELADTPGNIVDGLPLGDSFLIYKDDSIYIMNYVGTPYIFSFKLLSPTIGCLAKNAVAEYEGGHFFIGNSDFYICNGQQLTPLLPAKLRRTVFDEISGENYEKCFVAADYVRNEMLACYPAGSSTVVNKAVIWNWKTNTFGLRDLPNVSSMASGIVEITEGAKWSAEAALNGAITASSPATTGNLVVTTTTSTPAFTTSGTVIIDDEQITYTGLTGTTFTGITRGANLTTPVAHGDASVVNQFTTTWDATSDPWGATNYDDHQNNLVFTDVTNTKIFRDNKGNQKDTATMEAYVERTGYDLGDPSTVKFVSAVYPQIEVSGNNTINLYVGTQMSTEEAIEWNPATNGTPYLFNPNAQSKVSCRISGKYFGIKVESTNDIDWKLHGVAFETKPRGKRGSRMA